MLLLNIYRKLSDRVLYYLDVKLADLIGDLTGGTKLKIIYRLVETLYVVVWRSIYIFPQSPGAVSRSPTCEI